MPFKDTLKNYWKHSLAIMALLAAIAGGILDIKQLILDGYHWLSPKKTLSLSHTPNKLHTGDTFMLSYQAPKHGYLSLWNKDDNAQKVVKLLPIKGMNSLQLNANINHQSIKLKATASGRDTFILIWTPDNQAHHLPHQTYQHFASFDADLASLRSKADVLVTKLDVSIFKPDRESGTE